MLVAAASLATPAPAGAQVLLGYLFGDLLASETFNLGFEIGLNFADLEGLGASDRVRKTVFGLFADWRFSEHVHLGGAVLPIAARGAKGLEPQPTGDPVLDGLVAGGTMTRTLSYVEIPVLLRWAPHRENGFRIGAGPSLGLITGANDRYETATGQGTPYVLERDLDDVRSPDFGLSLDVEWRFALLSIAARYTHGLTDVATAADGTGIRTRTLTGTGRIYLGRRRSEGEPSPLSRH